MKRYGSVAYQHGTSTKIELVNVDNKCVGVGVTERGGDGFIMRRITLELTDLNAIEQMRDVLNTFLDEAK